jgi:hypothetical protein
MTEEAHEKAKNAPAVPPTKEEIEAEQMHRDLHDMDDDHDDHVEAEGMIDPLGNQMHDSEIDLKHRMEEFWDMDKNKDAFLSTEDFAHLVRRPGNLVPDAFNKLDLNKDGAVSISEYCHGFHDSGHAKEPWFHHKYGFVYGDELPDHFKDAKAGAVKKGTPEHEAALSGMHPSQTQKKLDDAAKDKKMKELNEKAHHEEKKDDAEHDALADKLHAQMEKEHAEAEAAEAAKKK